MSAIPTPLKASISVEGVPFPPFRRGSTLPGPGLPEAEEPARLLECADTGRRIAVEALIRERFACAYGARIERFMPRLFGLQRPDGPPLGAFGLREAARHPLFLEHYLDLPVEQAIGAAVGEPVERRQVVEVGQFAGTGAGAFRTLILLLTERLHAEECRWVVFTGTTALRNAFGRLGLAPVELGAADPARLSPAERAGWGRYYEHSPRVMCGNVDEGYAAVARHLAGKAP